MPTQTTHLGLITWSGADSFLLSDFVSNNSTLDAYPGVFLCTSATHPSTWGASQKGMEILEIDTGIKWRWNGSAFARIAGTGFLAQTTRTSDISTTVVAPTYVTALSQSITVPAGGRSVLILAELPVVQSSGGVTAVALFRDAGQLTAWSVQGDLLGGASDQPRNGTQFFVDTPTSGSHTYTVQFACQAGFTGTAYIRGSAASPDQLTLVEI